MNYLIKKVNCIQLLVKKYWAILIISSKIAQRTLSMNIIKGALKIAKELDILI